jgi:polyhydroxyalkanoate synthase
MDWSPRWNSLPHISPVIGEIYREFVKYCYQQNLFIKNQMKVDGVLVDLKTITAPFLNVVAQKDDLVAPPSSEGTKF